MEAGIWPAMSETAQQLFGRQPVSSCVDISLAR